MTANWTGNRATGIRQWWAGQLPVPCARCGRYVQVWQPWDVGHILSRNLYPHLTWERSNTRPEHRKCNRAESARTNNATRKSRPTRRTMIL